MRASGSLALFYALGGTARVDCRTSGIADADPHGLVLMLMDAAVERMTKARGCMQRGDIVRKAKLLHSCISHHCRAARLPRHGARRRHSTEP
jgi:hypothetical protein